MKLKSSDSSMLGRQIYVGANNRLVTVIKLFSLSSSLIGLAVMPWLHTQISSSSLVFKLTLFGASGFFILLTPILIHTLARRYVLSMYYNESTKRFSAVRYNLLMQQRTVSFTPEQIEDSLASPLSTFRVGNQDFLIDPDELMRSDPEAYVIFMRYDQPIDLDKYKVIPNKSEQTNTSCEDQRNRVE